jgi:hypothetical protein
MRHWDRENELQKRKILLLVDYCPAQPVLGQLEDVKQRFLPANTTSVLQLSGSRGDKKSQMPLPQAHIIKNYRMYREEAGLYHNSAGCNPMH